MNSNTNNKEEADGVITVCINETDLISREFKDCYECALACAIQRTTGKFPDVGCAGATLYDSHEDRIDLDTEGMSYSLEPRFPKEDYNALRKRAINREKVFHYIKLIPVQ